MAVAMMAGALTIMWYGGDATAAREAVRAASASDRNALIALPGSP